MRDLIHQWIQNTLGIVITMSPEMFALKVKDGHLLSEMLKNYEIITQEQLDLIVKSESRHICLANFQRHIKFWLEKIGVKVKDEELLQIVNSKGTAALNLFYQVYLELNSKDKLFFITQQRLNEKLRPKTDKFTVQPVKESLLDDMPSPKCRYGAPIEAAYDIVHWQQDRLEMLLNRCREAKEEYLSYIRSKPSPAGSFMAYNVIHKPEEGKLEIMNEPAGLPNQSYEELMMEMQKAIYMEKFVPDPNESKRIWKRLHIKQLKHAENLVFKKDLERDIMKTFWQKVSEEEEDHFTKNITDALVKQSLYEKQMVQKLGEVKLQKDVMIQNKRLVEDAISRQREADFVEKLILKEKKLNEKEFTYYLEKERVHQLHRKLYEEKLRLKAKRHYNMCSEAVKDIVNVTFKESDYKEEFGEEPSRRVKDMWRKMFVAAVSLDGIVKPIENIVKSRDERPDDIEKIIHLEIDRQDRIDQQDFDSYLAFEWPWLLDDIELAENSLYEMECGLNVLGSLVSNLLVAKYPYPPLPAKPDFPNIQITACINGFNEMNYLPMLQKILAQREVLVVEMQDAVNYCMHAYKTEINVEMEVEVFEPEKKNGKDKKGKEKPKNEPKSKKGEKSKAGKDSKGKSPAEPVEVLPAKMERLVQTPKVFPCEEIPLTVQAELGKIADEELSSGRPLTDHLLVAMFVEYLKSKPDIKGWVLINYPSTYEQAALLEENLTGLPVPELADDQKTQVTIQEIAELDQKSDDKPLDDNSEFRKSKLLPNPVAVEKPLFYDTALTAYIKVIQKVAEEEDPNDSLPPIFKDLENNANPLDRFYSDLGCNYSFYYQKYDFDTVKYLAKLVIGDYSIPLKTSVEIFGDSIKYVNANWNTGDQSQKGSSKVGDKKEKPKPKEKIEKKDENESKKGDKGDKGGKKGKGKAGSVVIVHEDKFTQIPEVEEEVEVILEPVAPPKAGEPGWEYTSFPFPEELQIALASLWENAEEVYREDFGQVFFLNRIVVNAIMPFVDFVKTHMNIYITRPDNKQYYLREFQRTYNEFDDDHRNDEEFKAELHCKISEMKDKLFEMCDTRMMEAEQERCDLIRKQWPPKQFIEMVNNYINAFQLELDRFVDSLLLAGDYYTGVVTKMPNDAVINKEQLPKLDAEDQEIIEAVGNLLETVDDEIFQNPEETETEHQEYYVNEQNANVNNFVRDILNSLPFRQKVEDILNKALEFVQATQVLATSIMEKLKVLFAPQSTKGKKSPTTDKKGGKVGASNRARRELFEVRHAETQHSEKTFAVYRYIITKSHLVDTKGNVGEKLLEKSGGNILTLFEPEEVVRLNAERILDEWSCVIRGETARVTIRLNLIMADLFRNLKEVLTPIREIFHSIFEEIRTRYDNEMDSIQKCCMVLTMAVEEEVKIQQELLLVDASFYINPETILFPDRVPQVTPISEINKAGVFTIDQLDKMVDILLDLAPSGYIPQRCFLFLLQDWIVSEDGPVKVPELWINLEPKGVERLLNQLFNNIEYVQWKDFILYNLMVRFPSESELLAMRKEFRKCDPDYTELITDYHFLQTKLWFEAYEQDEYRIRLMKHLIFKLYRVRNDKLNYTAMLLDCCKDEDSKIGLVKALELSIGKLVCWNKCIGEQFVEEILCRRNIHNEQVEQRNEEMRVNKEMAEEILGSLIDKTVHVCDSVVIEDLNQTTDRTEDDRDTSRYYDDDLTGSGSTSEDNIMRYLRKIAAEDTTEQDKPVMEEANAAIISYEVEAAPAMVYFLPLDVLIAVITTSLPWHAKVITIKDRSFRETVEDIYQQCRNPNFQYDVLAHEFLNHPRFIKLIGRASKFLVKDPVKIVEGILEDQRQGKERNNL